MGTDSKPKLSPAQLHSSLVQFCGTEQYHQVGMFSRVVCTDGVHFLRQEAACFWLPEAIASYMLPLPRMVKKYGEDFAYLSFWTLQSDGLGGALLEAKSDTRAPVKVRQEIPYTDFPFPDSGEFKLYCGVGGSEERPLFVIMLPAER